jgi:hypothetical protein
MENKPRRFLGVFGTLILGGILENIYRIGICDQGVCSDVVGEGMGMTLSLFGLAVFVLFLILSLMKEAVFQSWWKFAKWYLGIAAVLIVITPGTGGGGLFIGMGGGYDREGMIWFTAGLFFIISIILIIKKAIQTRGRGDVIRCTP